MRNVKVFNRVLTPADVDQYMDDIESVYKKVCPEFCWTAYAVDELTLSMSSKYRMTVPDEYKRNYDIVEAAAYAIFEIYKGYDEVESVGEAFPDVLENFAAVFHGELVGVFPFEVEGKICAYDPSEDELENDLCFANAVPWMPLFRSRDLYYLNAVRTLIRMARPSVKRLLEAVKPDGTAWGQACYRMLKMLES